jgi:hypothetical protein
VFWLVSGNLPENRGLYDTDYYHVVLWSISVFISVKLYFFLKNILTDFCISFPSDIDTRKIESAMDRAHGSQRPMRGRRTWMDPHGPHDNCCIQSILYLVYIMSFPGIDSLTLFSTWILELISTFSFHLFFPNSFISTICVHKFPHIFFPTKCTYHIVCTQFCFHA